MTPEELNEKVWEEYQELKRRIKKLVIGILCAPLVAGIFMLIVWGICEWVYHYVGV